MGICVFKIGSGKAEAENFRRVSLNEHKLKLEVDKHK